MISRLFKEVGKENLVLLLLGIVVLSCAFAFVFCFYLMWAIVMLEESSGANFNFFSFLVGPILIAFMSCFYGVYLKIWEIINGNYVKNRPQLSLYYISFVFLFFLLLLWAFKAGYGGWAVSLVFLLIILMEPVVSRFLDFLEKKFVFRGRERNEEI